MLKSTNSIVIPYVGNIRQRQGTPDCFISYTYKRPLEEECDWSVFKGALWVEFKDIRTVLKPIQRITIQKINETGGAALVCRRLDRYVGGLYIPTSSKDGLSGENEIYKFKLYDLTDFSDKIIRIFPRFRLL